VTILTGLALVSSCGAVWLAATSAAAGAATTSTRFVAVSLDAIFSWGTFITFGTRATSTVATSAATASATATLSFISRGLLSSSDLLESFNVIIFLVLNLLDNDLFGLLWCGLNWLARHDGRVGLLRKYLEWV